MMDLFSSNISTTYPTTYGTTKNESKLDVVNVNKPFEIKDKLGNIDGYFWYQGNSVDLVFNLDGYVILGGNKYNSIGEVIGALDFEAKILDHRNNTVMKFTNSPYDVNKLVVSVSEDVEKCSVTLTLTSDKSSQIAKGRYRIELTASLGYEYHETVFPADTCIFEVR